MSDDLRPLGPQEAAQQWLDIREPSVAQSTYENNQTTLEQFVAWCGQNEIDNLNTLTGRHMSQFVAWRRSQPNVSDITVQKQLGAIREFLGWAADVEAVEQGLRERVHAPKVVDGAEARDVKLEASRAEAILEYLNRFQYGSRDHAIIALLWRTGMRLGALRTIDLEDLRPDDDAIDLHHRPDSETPLKNGPDGERWVWLGPVYYQIIEDYVENNRIEARDDYGREPLFTSKQGRLSESAIRDCCYRMTHPCMMEGCPHDREPETCEAVGVPNLPSKCPSARSPHAFRRGAITSHLNDGVPADVVSERMDVSLEVLYKHYDARRPDEKMEQRRKFLKDK